MKKLKINVTGRGYVLVYMKIYIKNKDNKEERMMYIYIVQRTKNCFLALTIICLIGTLIHIIT